MKKHLPVLLGSFLLICFIVPLAAEALQIQNPLKHNTFWDLLKAVIGFLMWVAIPITAIVIVISGYYFVTSMGDPVKVTTAKKMVIYALVGLIIILCSWSIIQIIKNIFPPRVP